MKEKIKTILKDKNNITILIISMIAIIVGGFAFSFMCSFLIIAGLNVILFLPLLIDKNKNKKSKKKNKKKNNKDDKKIFKIIVSIFLGFSILGMLSLFIFFSIIVAKAPNFKPDNLYNREASILYDSDGKIFAKVGSEIREKVTFDEMSEVLIDAIIATEDSRFFQHNGFDLPRFLKASFGQALGQDAGGASTLTMQLSKNHFTSSTATGIEGLMRKFTDIYFSIFKIEKKYTKFEIFEFYANSANFGARGYGGAYGVEQASQIYFGKKAKDLALPEAAMIAGLLQAPNAYDPFVNPEQAEARRKTVLYLMERHGYISKKEKELAEKIHITELLYEHEDMYSEYQGFINAVTAEVEKITGVDPYSTSLEIYTTMDIKKQDAVNDILKGETFKWENETVDGGIAVIDVNTGAVVALGAGRNHEGQKVWNLATDMKRHIGSTAKPIIDYAPGIEFNNWSSYQPFIDEPHSYSTGMSIRNWDSNYKGLVTLRQAIIDSRNIPALKAFQSVDNKKLHGFIKSIGLNPEIENGRVHEAHALGAYTGESPLSLAASYAPFANGGYYMKPFTFTKIKFRDNNKIIEHKVKKERVMRESTAYIMTDVLLDTTPSAARVSGVSLASKTGTSNFPAEVFKKYNLPSYAVNDLWMAGFDPEYSVAVWYGYDKVTSKTFNRFGSVEPRKLFHQVIKGIATPNKKFNKPNNVIEVEIEKESYPAMLPSPFTPKNMITKELFVIGFEPTEVSQRYSALENATNLKAVQELDKVKLTWDPIKTPKAIDNNALTNLFNKMFNNKATGDKFLKTRLNYNKSNIGEIGYNVYIKNNEELQLLGFTQNNFFEHTNNNSLATYVIKTAYSIFKDNMSEGIETTIELDNTASTITSMLIGDKTINLSINDIFVDINPAINVLDATEDVTYLSEISKTIINDDTAQEVPSINTSIEGTFTINYKVKYKEYNKTHTRKVIIK